MRGNKSRVKVVGAVALATLLGLLIQSLRSRRSIRAGDDPGTSRMAGARDQCAVDDDIDRRFNAFGGQPATRCTFSRQRRCHLKMRMFPCTGAKAPTKPPAGALSPAERAAASGHACVSVA